jgi:hypothetical protein
MVWLIVHALLAVAVVIAIVLSNRSIFTRPVTGPMVSVLEAVCYLAAVASIPLCWYFNIQFVNEYSQGAHNPLWGPGSWVEFIRLGYDNPAASSASVDYTIASVILLPLFTIVDGRHRGVRHPWLYVLLILFASLAFAWGFYLAMVERQRRHRPADQLVAAR